MDQKLMAASAGYVRDAFVMASIDQLSEYEHLERILMDAICEEPLVYEGTGSDDGSDEIKKNIANTKKTNTNHSRIASGRIEFQGVSIWRSHFH